MYLSAAFPLAVLIFQITVFLQFLEVGPAISGSHLATQLTSVARLSLRTEGFTTDQLY